MPIIGDNFARVERSFSQGLPKNFRAYADLKNEKFLDNTQHLIDALAKTNTINPLLKYQKKIFGAALTKEHVYKWIKNNPGKPMVGGSGMGGLRGTFVNFGVTLGSELNTLTSGGTGSTPFATTTLYIAKFDTGTTGHTYNEISVSSAGSSGNMRLGVYRDLTSLTMSDLVGETGEIAAFSDYAYKTVPAFTLPASGVVYGAFHQSVNNSINYGNGNNRYSASRTYQALPASIAVGDDGTTIIQEMKIRGN